MLGQLFRAGCEHVRPTGMSQSTRTPTLSQVRVVCIVIVAERQERKESKREEKRAREKKREKREEKRRRKTPPCVDPKRTRKTPACSTHAGVFPVHTEASWTHTRRRFESSHGEVFRACQAAPHHTTNRIHNTTTQRTHHNTKTQNAHPTHTLSTHTTAHTKTSTTTHTLHTHTTHTNAWTRARRATDRDLQTNKWMLAYVHRGQPTMILHSIKICNMCNVCNFMRTLLFLELISPAKIILFLLTEMVLELNNDLHL